MGLSFSYTTLPAVGEVVSGDAVLIRQEEGLDFFALLDVLGHGAEAAKVAQGALSYLQKAPLDAGIASLVEGLHNELRGTRGAAAMIVLVQQDQLQGCGVGNVALRSFGTNLPIVSTPGVLGLRLSRLRSFQGRLLSKTRLVAFSDGISNRFHEKDLEARSPKAACDHLFSTYRKPQDDATVLVVDVL